MSQDQVPTNPMSAGDLQLEIHSDPAAIADAWRSLEITGIGTLFQSYAWVSAWCRTAAKAYGEDPVIAVWYKTDGQAAIIWPLAASLGHASRVLTWLGQGHSGYNMGLYDRDYAGAIDASFLNKLIAGIASQLPEAVAFHLIDQPEAWNGYRNPFFLLPHQPSANVSFEMTLQEDPNQLFRTALSSDTRRRLERLERRLKEAHTVAFGLASTREERLEMLSVFLRQKSAQFEKMGGADVFSHPSIQSFYRELFTEQRGASFESAYIKTGGEIVATSNGMKFQDRFYHLTLSMSMQADENLSPGRLLSREHIAHQCRQETAIFDFGPGSGRHKQAWHPRPIAYFESNLPLRRSGTANTAFRRAKARAKYLVLSSATMQKAIGLSKTGKRKLARFFSGSK